MLCLSLGESEDPPEPRTVNLLEREIRLKLEELSWRHYHR
jgi:hypothetical protein